MRFEYIRNNSNDIIGYALVHQTVEDFDKHLGSLREVEGNLERHHENHKVWVTRHQDDAIVMSFDEIENELSIYFN